MAVSKGQRTAEEDHTVKPTIRSVPNKQSGPKRCMRPGSIVEHQEEGSRRGAASLPSPRAAAARPPQEAPANSLAATPACERVLHAEPLSRAIRWTRP